MLKHLNVSNPKQKSKIPKFKNFKVQKFQSLKVSKSENIFKNLAKALLKQIICDG